MANKEHQIIADFFAIGLVKLVRPFFKMTANTVSED